MIRIHIVYSSEKMENHYESSNDMLLKFSEGEDFGKKMRRFVKSLRGCDVKLRCHEIFNFIRCNVTDVIFSYENALMVRAFILQVLEHLEAREIPTVSRIIDLYLALKDESRRRELMTDEDDHKLEDQSNKEDSLLAINTKYILNGYAEVYASLSVNPAMDLERALRALDSQDIDLMELLVAHGISHTLPQKCEVKFADQVEVEHHLS